MSVEKNSGVVIVGAGQAALECAATLRKEGYDRPITIIGTEHYPPYQRPPLSKAYLLGDMDASRLELRNAAFFAEQNITLVTGRTVTSIDRDARTVRDDQGAVYSYDDLVLATGARVRKLDLPGSDLGGVFYLRTLDDVNAIEAQLSGVETVAVVGAGFIGLEFAAVARKLGKTVTVIEAADRVMGRAVTGDISAYFEGLHRRYGCTVLTGTGVSRFSGADGKLTSVALSNGETVAADLVLIGIGVNANMELAVDAGIDCASGIVVDGAGRTSDAHVYAAGDCAVYAHPLVGEAVRLESVQNAVDQGKVVATATCGGQQVYDAVPWFWSDQYDIKLQMAGWSAGTDQHVVRGSMEDDRFSVFHFRDGVLRAVDSINSGGDHMVARRLLGSDKSITPEQAADMDLKLKTLL